MRKCIKIFMLLLLATSPGEVNSAQKEGEGGQLGSTPAVVTGETKEIRLPEATPAPSDLGKDAVTQETLKGLPWTDTSLGARLPISIDSQEMTVKGQEGKVLFKGTVRIQRGDVTMKADQAEVLLENLGHQTPKNGTSPSVAKDKEITKIEIAHNVELTQGSRRVLAQRGMYDARRQEMVFSGEPEMWEDGYNIKGKMITLSLTQKRTIIEGSRLTIN